MSTLLPFRAPSLERGWVELGEEEGTVLRFHPTLKTGCHQAQLGMRLGHQHVYAKLSLQMRADKPLLPAAIALFLSLISFHSPMRDVSFRSSPARSLSTLLLRLLPFHAIIYFGPYDVSLTLPAPPAGFVRDLWRNILFINFQGEYSWLVNSKLSTVCKFETVSIADEKFYQFKILEIRLPRENFHFDPSI